MSGCQSAAGGAESEGSPGNKTAGDRERATAPTDRAAVGELQNAAHSEVEGGGGGDIQRSQRIGKRGGVKSGGSNGDRNGIGKDVVRAERQLAGRDCGRAIVCDGSTKRPGAVAGLGEVAEGERKSPDDFSIAAALQGDVVGRAATAREGAGEFQKAAT